MKIKAASIPHSWPVSDWPQSVTPGNNRAARHLVRVNKAELMECGALCRVGRNLTIIGEGYAVFLARQMKRVDGFKIAAQGRRRLETPPEA